MSPSINHSYLCKQLIIAIESTEQWEAWPELTLNIGSGLIPDIAVYQRGKIKPNFLEDKIKCDILPHLVIEIASPSQSIHDLMLKANQLITAGISVVWTIEPYGNLIYVSTLQGRKVELASTIESEGIMVDFKKIFLN